MNRDETCQLSYAGDMVMMLIRGILDRCEGVEKCLDVVESGELEVCLTLSTVSDHIYTSSAPPTPTSFPGHPERTLGLE